MKHPFLLFFLFTTTMILTVCQIVFAQSPPPKLYAAKDCPNNKCPDNIPPVLQWSAGNYHSFKVCIFIKQETSTNTNTSKLIHCEDSIETGEYLVPMNILESKKTYLWTVCALDEDKNDITLFTTPKGTFETSLICKEGNVSDKDCDGIKDTVEDKLGTSPYKKTLFVRPKRQVEGGKFEYWDKFIELFPGDSKAGFAKIPQFYEAGIEIVVIGAHKTIVTDHNEIGEPIHSYERFSCPIDKDFSDDFCNIYSSTNGEYNPAIVDSNLADGILPCSIMEIQLIMERDTCGTDTNDYCKCGECKNGYNYKGHINFQKIKTYVRDEVEEKYYWSWDRKGTIKGKTDIDDYRTPRLFDFPLKNYFSEGAYEIVDKGAKPLVPIVNDEIHCNHTNIICNELNPSNLIDPKDCQDPISPPFLRDPPYETDSENKVEFTPVVFYNPDETNESHTIGQIKSIFSKIFFVKEIKRRDRNFVSIERVSGSTTNMPIVIDRGVAVDEGDSVYYIDNDTVYVKPYTEDDGLRRTIVHEMGHALMMGVNYPYSVPEVPP